MTNPSRVVLVSVFFLAVLAAVAACVPDLDDDGARITAPRVLAVRAVPAEARAGQAVALTALVATPSGQAASAETLEWAMCLARKPLTELGPVAQECIDRFSIGGDIFQRLGRGQGVTATLPADVCRRFGPIAPPAEAGGVAGRPVDPDLSGGYYQPIVLGNEQGAALGSVRLSCGVVGVPSAEAVRYNQSARPNENPEIDRLEIVSGAAVQSIAPEGEAPGAVVAAGARVQLRATWSACPEQPVCGDGMCTAGENQSTCAADCRDAPKGCTGAERYLWPNPETRRVQERREAMTVAWYSEAGTFDEAQTGRSETDTGVDAANVWTAPAQRGLVRLWTVLRDDRGGVGWREYVVTVE